MFKLRCYTPPKSCIERATKRFDHPTVLFGTNAARIIDDFAGKFTGVTTPKRTNCNKLPPVQLELDFRVTFWTLRTPFFVLMGTDKTGTKNLP